MEPEYLMVQIRFSKKIGGEPRYFKVAKPDLETFRNAYGHGDPEAKLLAADGRTHVFPPGTIQSISDRPYDPTYPKRRKK